MLTLLLACATEDPPITLEWRRTTEECDDHGVAHWDGPEDVVTVTAILNDADVTSGRATRTVLGAGYPTTITKVGDDPWVVVCGEDDGDGEDGREIDIVYAVESAQ